MKLVRYATTLKYRKVLHTDCQLHLRKRESLSCSVCCSVLPSDGPSVRWSKIINIIAIMPSCHHALAKLLSLPQAIIAILPLCRNAIRPLPNYRHFPSLSLLLCRHAIAQLSSLPPSIIGIFPFSHYAIMALSHYAIAQSSSLPQSIIAIMPLCHCPSLCASNCKP